MEASISVNLISISFLAAIVFTGFFRTISKKFDVLIDLPDKNNYFATSCAKPYKIDGIPAHCLKSWAARKIGPIPWIL